MSAVNVDSGNSNYSSVDGVLLNKSRQTIIFFPPAKTTFAVPSTVTTIGSVFSESRLTSVTIPASITVIPDNAFKGCSGLADVTFPSTVTAIEKEAFYGCSKLTQVTFLSETPPGMGTGVFFSANVRFFVPASAVDAYRASASWSAYANRIVVPEEEGRRQR
jgi:hypothetical protein